MIVLAGALVLLLLLGGGAALFVLRMREQRAEAAAEARLDAMRAVSDKAAEAKAISDFLETRVPSAPESPPPTQ